MSVLEHLDELRGRLARCAVAYAVAVGICWTFAGTILEFLLRPIRRHLFDGADITFIHIAEPFMVKVKAAALAAVFLSAPYLLWQLWAFVAPGLYDREKRMVVPFLVFGTLFFFGGGAFGYYTAVPQAAAWLIQQGEGLRAAITLRSAFTFESRILLGMGAVFEMPILIFFLSRLGIVTPGFLMRHFRLAVLVIAVVSAVITPTGDMITMAMFVVPMVLLYLLGVTVSWIAARRDSRKEAG